MKVIVINLAGDLTGVTVKHRWWDARYELRRSDICPTTYYHGYMYELPDDVADLVEAAQDAHS